MFVASLCAGAVCSWGGVRINELVAAPSTRLLQRTTNGMWQVGTGTPWMQPAFDDTFWPSAGGSFGYAYGLVYSNDLAGELTGPTMTLYMRRPFYVANPAAYASSTMSLAMDYDAGFIAYLNGREVRRKNMGAPGSFAFFDQPARNPHPAGTNATWGIGVVSNLLVAGTNWLAVQVHGWTNQSFGASVSLHVDGGAELVSENAMWKYFVGRHEPSGGIIDGVSPPSSIRGREWTLATYPVDAIWMLGPGGFGYGFPDLGTDVEFDMRDVCNTLYVRRTFVVTPEIAAMTNLVRFMVNWDDGYVAYLNGLEFARTNLGAAGSFVPYTMGATASRSSTATLTQSLASAQAMLIPGTNVLAIELHNVNPYDADARIVADLAVAGGPTLVAHGDDWRYFVGVESPVPEPDPDDMLIEPEFADWIELYNDGAAGVSLSGWKLSDDKDWKAFWVLPDTAFLPAGGYLTLLCTGHDLRSSTSTVWHTNFRLDPDGDYVGLRNAADAVVSEISPKYPKQSPFHSYGWDTNAAAWRYFLTPSPGACNTGTVFTLMCDKPKFGQKAGWYTNSIAVTLSTDTPGAQIRYTSDGTDPSSNSALYAGGIGLSTACSLRVRAFLTNAVPSPVETRTFLVNQPTNLLAAPAVMLVGDPAETLFKSNGVTAVVGGAYDTNAVWYALTEDDYHIPRVRGRNVERPVSIEFGYPGSNSFEQADAGLRIAGSTYTRPRYRLQNMSNTWYGSAVDQRPQFNLYFRSEYGPEPISFPFIPDVGKESYESIRLRGGHNDNVQPFVHDELARRLMSDTGQPAARGLMAALYVNGIFRCYYNPAERYDTRFFQERFGGTNEWDIINHAGLTSGDNIAWNNLLNFAQTNNFTVLSNYQRICTMVDVDNLIDYILVNAYLETTDWPNNNWYAARERSATGRFRFHEWDAEMNCGHYGGRSNDYPIFTAILNPAPRTSPSAFIYARLRTNHEFRVRFADRIHKHLFNGGALSESNVLGRATGLKAELNPLMRYVRNQDVQIEWFTNWAPSRPEFLFAELMTNKFWVYPGPPLFVTPGGQATNGTAVTLSNTNGAGTVYYAFDGADPRAVGGAVAGTAYTNAIVLDRSRYILARVLDGTNWSPVAEATYSTELPALVITELMYNPTSTNQTEFIELYNYGSTPIPLAPVSLTDGVSFHFADGVVTSIAPGEYVLVVQNLAAFAAAYNTNGLKIAGSYTGKLANEGETLTLMHDFFGVLQQFTFKDGWYPQTDGDGFTLTIRDPAQDRALWDAAAGWKPGAIAGGSPGAADPGGIPDPGAVVVNELLAHTDASAVGDWIELYNTTVADIPIGGWYLSDNPSNPRLYRIPSNTILGAHGFAVFDTSNHFGRAELGTNAFSFSEYGESAVVSSGLTTNGVPTGYRDTRTFGASEREVTFGRYVRSDGKEVFVAQKAATKGAFNAGPRVGPLLVSEILYLPATNRFEYVEVYNCSTSAIPLYDPAAPTNQWRMTGGIGFVFPASQTSAPFSTFVVTATNAAAFRAAYGLPGDYPVYGPFTGRLNNAGEGVRIEMPLGFDLTNRPYAEIDLIQYEGVAPWPVPTNGVSIERIRLADFGNDPVNWRIGSLNGTPGPRLGEDSDGDGFPDAWEGTNGFNPLVANAPGADTDGDGQPDSAEFTAGTGPRNASDFFAMNVLVSNRIPVVEFLARTAAGAGYDTWNRFYSLDRAAGLMPTGWVCVGSCSNVPGTNQLVRQIDTGATSGPAFYRGRVWMVPR